MPHTAVGTVPHKVPTVRLFVHRGKGPVKKKRAFWVACQRSCVVSGQRKMKTREHKTREKQTREHDFFVLFGRRASACSRKNSTTSFF